MRDLFSPEARVVAGLDELMKLGDCLEAQLTAHTEGLGPIVTEHLVKLFVSAKGGDTQKKSQ